MGFYSVPQGNPFGVENYDPGEAMEASTCRLSHRLSGRQVNLRKMLGRDDALYGLGDFTRNIELENTKQERADEIREKRQRKREAYRANAMNVTTTQKLAGYGYYRAVTEMDKTFTSGFGYKHSDTSFKDRWM